MGPTTTNAIAVEEEEEDINKKKGKAEETSRLKLMISYRETVRKERERGVLRDGGLMNKSPAASI